MAGLLRRLNLLRLSGISSILGFDLTEKRARVVELTIRGGLLNKYTSSFIAKKHFTIQYDNGASPIERAQLLVTELNTRNIATRYAATTIQSLGVRTVSTQIPRTIDNITEWIDENYEKLIRVPVSRKDIVSGYEIISEDSSSLLTEITFVRKSDIDSAEQFFTSAGLMLLTITAGVRDAINALHCSDFFVTKGINRFAYQSNAHSTVTVFENEKRIRTYRVDNAELESTLDQSSIIVGGEMPTEKRGYQILSLPSEYILAIGCALKGFIPEQHTLNFLSSNAVQQTKQQVAKNLFHRTVIACGGLLLVLLLIQTIAMMYLKNVDDGLENQLINSGLDYRVLSQIEAQNEELRLELQKANSLEYRSNYAAILHVIAASVPDNLWLYKIDIDASTGRVKIYGYTSNGDHITEFLKRCTVIPSLRDVRLSRSGIPLQSEDMSLIAKRVPSTMTFQVQAALRGKE